MIRPIFTTIILILGFVLAALFIPPDPMTEILSAGVFIAAGFGIYRWAPAALRSFVGGARTEASWGILGLVLWLISEAGKRVYAVLFLQLDRPEYMQDLHISPFLTAMSLVGICLIVLATRFEGEKPSKLPTTVAAVVAFLGVLLSAALPFVIAKIVLIGTALAKIGVVLIPH